MRPTPSLMSSLSTLAFAAALLAPASASAGWGAAHLERAWSGDLEQLEVDQLTETAAEADPASAGGYWTLVLLAIHWDAAGDREISCAVVDRFDGIRKRANDLRLETLRAACSLEAGDLVAAERHARRAIASAASQPIDYVRILRRAYELRALSLMAQYERQAEGATRARVERALVAWQRSARELNDRVALVEALAEKARFAQR